MPELEIKPDAGFSTDIDIFKRAGFGERLSNLIANADDYPVIALDSGWGEGKSTFIKMWRGYLENHRNTRIKTIYFDAFENDYQKDSFLTLASEIYQLISSEDEEKQVEFREKTIKAFKSFSRGAIKIAVKAGTAGVVDGSAFDSVEKEISNLVSEQVDDIVKDKFKNVQRDKLALKEFKSYLEVFAETAGEGSPIIFIIDELDRCKPDFALSLLEQIKHLFSVNGISFLLVTNRVQLEEIIKTKYGKNINPTNYLHKFINLWLSLPRTSGQYNDDGVVFLNYAIKSMMVNDEKIVNSRTIEAFTEIVKYRQLSFREIERMLSYYSVIQNMTGEKKYYNSYQILIALACFLKASHPEALKELNGKLNYDDIIKLSRLDELVDETEYNTLFHMKKLLRFDLGSEEVRSKMMDEKEIQADSFRGMSKNIIVTINKWLSDINHN